jgi:flagellar motility protein MotE (MotC chaperone)
MTHPFKPFKQIADPDNPRKGAAFIFGIAVVIAGLMLVGRSAPSTAEEGSVTADPPVLSACADLPAASRLYTMLRERHITMAQRELNLKRGTEALNKKSTELSQQIEELRVLRAEVDRRINDWSQKSDSSKQERIANLVGVLSEIPAAGAARILLELEDDLAVDVLGSCDKARAGEILASLPPNRAASYASALAVERR